MERPKHGMRMGCSDSGRPEVYTDEQLSRIKDAWDNLSVFPQLQKTFWDTLPRDLKVEYIWSSWTYRVKDKA